MTYINRRIAVVSHDILMLMTAWELAWFARLNFAFTTVEMQRSIELLPVIMVVQALILWQIGLYRGVWRFASVPDLWNIIRAAAIGTLVASLVLFLLTRLEGVPRSIFVLYPVFLVFLLGAPRLIFRVWKDHSLSLQSFTAGKRVLVLGAGRAGEMLVREMLRDVNFFPVGLLDDLPSLRNARVQGVPVLGKVSELGKAIEDNEVELVVIAMPSADSEQMRMIVDLCERSNLPFRTVPRIEELMAGRVSLNELREVSIDDLLGRDAVELDWDSVHKGLSGRTVLITGGGGSIGSELCRQVARAGPTSLIVFDQSEYNLYRIEMTLRQELPNLNLHTILGDICDERAVKHLFEELRPNVVFHAAAYKHVPLLQTKIREALRNNVLGTGIIADAAGRHQCEAFVLISTDKAVKPTNIMGASKRIAEMYCESKSQQGTETKFVTVRFGNVLESAGSVVPLFREQIQKGGPVTVTHREITRYFMTITEATQLISQAGVMGKGGEIFVLNMGEPVKINYLAEQLIRLAGREPGQDIEIVYTGLRPGEKLHEELFHSDEQPKPTSHEKILLARHKPFETQFLLDRIAEMKEACRDYDVQRLEEIVADLVPELRDAPEPAINNIVDIQTKA